MGVVPGLDGFGYGEWCLVDKSVWCGQTGGDLNVWALGREAV